LHSKLGKTFVYVTHDQVEAMTLADRIVLLRDGVIEQVGTPLDLFERPNNTYVASFLGSPSMNFISVEVSGGGTSMTLPDGQTVAFGSSQFSGKLAAGNYLWGVRPEQLSNSASSESTLEATIEVVQPTGARSYASFNIGDAHVVAELDAHAVNTEGQKLTLSISLDRTNFFDPVTQNVVR